MKKNVKVMLLCVTFGALFACSEGDFDDSGSNSLFFNSKNFEWDWNNYYGYSVRPVCE